MGAILLRQSHLLPSATALDIPLETNFSSFVVGNERQSRMAFLPTPTFDIGGRVQMHVLPMPLVAVVIFTTVGGMAGGGVFAYVRFLIQTEQISPF